MLDNLLNVTCEAQIAASDGRRVVIFPRLGKNCLREQIDDAQARGLAVLAVALYNCHNSHLYGWRSTLQGRHWLGQPLVMQRKRGEYRDTQHALFVPAREQVFTLDEFRRVFGLGQVARLE